jgi:hypothetical protein
VRRIKLRCGGLSAASGIAEPALLMVLRTPSSSIKDPKILDTRYCLLLSLVYAELEIKVLHFSGKGLSRVVRPNTAPGLPCLGDFPPQSISSIEDPNTVVNTLGILVCNYNNLLVIVFTHGNLKIGTSNTHVPYPIFQSFPKPGHPSLAKMSEKPLGFGYQVAAGAIAGVSEVCLQSRPHAGRFLIRGFSQILLMSGLTL